MTPQLNAWDRRPNETAKAYAAFTIYRDMPPHERSLRQVAKTLNKSSALIGRWSGVHQWVTRCYAFDVDMDVRIRADLVLRASRARVRHSSIASKLLTRIEEKLEAKTVSVTTLRHTSSALASAARVEARALGIGERLEVTGEDGGPVEVGPPMSGVERRARLEELHAELSRRLSTERDESADPARAGKPDLSTESSDTPGEQLSAGVLMEGNNDD